MANHSVSNDLLYIKAYNEGRLTVTRKGKVKNNRTDRWIGCLGSSGYLHIAISIEGKSRSMYIHRLVWLVFMGPIPEGFEINHKNGNKLDNALSNLEMITSGENIKHAYKLGLKVYPDANGRFVRSEVGDLRLQFMNKTITIEQIMTRYKASRESTLEMLRGVSYQNEPNALRTIRVLLTNEQLKIAVHARQKWKYTFAEIKYYFAMDVSEETIRYRVQRYLTNPKEKVRNYVNL